MKQRLNEIDEHCSTIVKQMQDDVNKIRKRKESRESELKQVNNFDSDNHNNDKLSANKNRNNKEIIDKVSESENISDNHNGEIMLNNNNKDIVENVVPKSDIVSNSSNDESIKLVEVIEGIVVTGDELEREWRDSLKEYWGWRADFPVMMLVK